MYSIVFYTVLILILYKKEEIVMDQQTTLSTPNSIFDTIFNAVNTVYDSVSAPWIYNDVLPIGLMEYIQYITKDNNSTYWHYTFEINGILIYLVQTDMDENVKHKKIFLNNRPGLLIIFNSALFQKDTETNIQTIDFIYDTIFTFLNTQLNMKCSIFEGIHIIFTMNTIYKYFDNVEFSDFNNTTFTEQQLSDIGQYSIKELYDQLKILKFIK